MLEIVLNELSCKEAAETLDHADSIYTDFFTLADKIQDLKISTLRIRTPNGFGLLSIYNNHTIKEYLLTCHFEDRSRYLGYIAQQKFIQDNPYYTYKGETALGFGEAFENDLGTISFSTNNVWIDNTYTISREFLPDADSEIIIENFIVNNYLNIDGVINHAHWAKTTFKLKQEIRLKGIPDSETFWSIKEDFLPNIIFPEYIIDYFSKLGSIKEAKYQKVIHCILQLNNHCQNAIRGEAILSDLPINASPDSEATLNQYSEERTFTCKDGIERIYSVHAKLGSVRLYFRLIPELNQIEIGYVGKHLRTKKNH